MNIKSPASERIIKEQDYEKMSMFCWRVFLGLSLLVFALLMIAVCNYKVYAVVLGLGL